jgi:predicted PurR-regulated permease PerM
LATLSVLKFNDPSGADRVLLAFAVIIGGLLLGIPGALLAIPVAEIIRVIVTDLLAYRRARQGEKEPEITAETAARTPLSE